MKGTIQLMFVLMITSWLAACASDPLKAPCDVNASYCGTKTKINQW